MRLPIILTKFIKWRYSHLVTFSLAGASLELFMNFFHVGDARIYRSIRESMSTQKAVAEFEAEKSFFENVVSNDD